MFMPSRADFFETPAAAVPGAARRLTEEHAPLRDPAILGAGRDRILVAGESGAVSIAPGAGRRVLSVVRGAGRIAVLSAGPGEGYDLALLDGANGRRLGGATLDERPATLEICADGRQVALSWRGRAVRPGYPATEVEETALDLIA